MASASAQYLVNGPRLLRQSVNNDATIDLNSSGDKLGCVFIASDGTQAIEKIGIYCSALAGTSTTYRVKIEGIDSSGFPDGTDAGGGSPTAVTFSAVAAIYHELTLTNAFTPTDGTAYALVLEYDSGTIDGSNFATFHRSSASMTTWALPYAVQDITASWALIGTGAPQMVALYADGHPEPGTEFTIDVASVSFDTADTPDEIGCVWVAANSGTLVGVTMFGRMNNVAADYDIVIYDSVDSVLKTISVDGATRGSSAANNTFICFFEGVSVVAGSTYRLVKKAAHASQVSFLYEFLYPSSAIRLGAFGPLQKTSRADAGGWTDLDTSAMGMQPLMSDIDAGGGGLLVHPGMTGGING